MPIGDKIKGRLLNVTGDAIDGITKLIKKMAIKFIICLQNLINYSEVLFTGIKVIDLLEPYSKGGKIGLFGGAGVGRQ